MKQDLQAFDVQIKPKGKTLIGIRLSDFRHCNRSERSLRLRPLSERPKDVQPDQMLQQPVR